MCLGDKLPAWGQAAALLSTRVRQTAPLRGTRFCEFNFILHLLVFRVLCKVEHLWGSSECWPQRNWSLWGKTSRLRKMRFGKCWLKSWNCFGKYRVKSCFKKCCLKSWSCFGKYRLRSCFGRSMLRSCFGKCCFRSCRRGDKPPQLRKQRRPIIVLQGTEVRLPVHIGVLPVLCQVSEKQFLGSAVPEEAKHRGAPKEIFPDDLELCHRILVLGLHIHAIEHTLAPVTVRVCVVEICRIQPHAAIDAFAGEFWGCHDGTDSCCRLNA